MDGKRLKVLLIEDNPGDVRLIREMLLEAETTDIELEHADRLSAGIDRIAKGEIAVVLLDLALPDSQGLDTLAKVLSRFPEIPVVVLTGHGDEAVAVDAVRQGAQDYLVKGSVGEKLLARSIRYAMERKQMESALRRARDGLEKRVAERTADLLIANRRLTQEIIEHNLAEQALRESEERFRTIFEGACDSIFIKDMSLRYAHVNPAMVSLFGMPVSELVGKAAEDLFDEAAAAYIRDVDRRVLKGESVEETITRKINGMPVTFHEINVPMRNNCGEIVGICGISRDITDRVRSAVPRRHATTEYASDAMRETLMIALSVAEKDSVVLLLGESGSGKDHLARYIHEHSRRASGPFFSINCAAVARELAESELFGHERGAFTGAHGRKRGLLELAEGGTLLLNEIGELSVQLQAKLLTFLDTRQITRVGGEKSVSVHARLIAATNKDLEQEVRNKRFREDLFYRLNVFTIVVPPLRERRDDIPVIAGEILSRLAIEMQFSQVPQIDSNSMIALMNYNWPGNVRELRNVLERGLILSDGERFDIGSGILEEVPEHWSHTVTLGPGRTLQDMLNEVTESLCLEALKRFQGNKKAAASFLKISRDSLYRYLKEFGIDTKTSTARTSSGRMR